MAKDQDLPLNPLRISGACGRSMCCLKYEHPLYAEFKATAPAVGQPVDTESGPGRVVATTCRATPSPYGWMRTAPVARAAARVCGSRQADESSPTVDGLVGG
jgi:hypothetical protein